MQNQGFSFHSVWRLLIFNSTCIFKVHVLITYQCTLTADFTCNFNTQPCSKIDVTSKLSLILQKKVKVTLRSMAAIMPT